MKLCRHERINMRDHIIFSTLLLFFYLFALGQSQSEPCLCNDPAIMSSWGVFDSTGPCQGCPGIEPGFQSCHFFLDGIIQPSTLCKANRSCPSGCKGTWSSWSNIGICPLSCQQLQARYCYKREVFGNVRIESCAGGQGRSEQNRTVPCNHGNCDPSSHITTTREREAITPTPTPTPTPASTTTQAGLIEEENGRTITSLKPANSSKVTVKIQENPRTEATGTGTDVLLPAILGSVGILGFVAIAIAISIMWSRKKRAGTDYPSYASGTTTTTIRNENYESVGPPLPYRVTATAPVMPATEPAQSENVPNLLYHPMDGTETLAVPSPTNKTDSGTYLIPVEGTYEEEPESIYSHIDENR